MTDDEVFKFSVVPGQSSCGIQLLYIRDEYSFYCEDIPTTRGVSFVVNDIELWFDDDGQVLYVDGYCPYQGWQQTSLRVPAYVSAGLFMVSPDPMDVQSGTAIRLNDLDTSWPVHVNAEGWVCIGDPSDHGDVAAEFSPNCVAVLKGDALIALWLRPVMCEASDVGE